MLAALLTALACGAAIPAIVSASTSTTSSSSTAADTGATNLGTDSFGAIAVDDTGQHVFVSLPHDNAIDEFTFSGSLVRKIPDIRDASGMTVDGGELYIVENTTGDVVSIPTSAATTRPTTVASGLVDATWIVATAGKLWVAENYPNGSGWSNVVSVDPTTGATTTLPGTYYTPDLAVSPADPNTLFIADDDLSSGELFEYDVGTTPATLIASNNSTPQENIQNFAVSPDGTRVIPAGGAVETNSGTAYLFEELSSSTLQPDGLQYPASAYPSAVAVSASGLLATGIDNGPGSPDIRVFKLGDPKAVWTATTNEPGDIPPHGLALSANGADLFAVTAPDLGGELYFRAYSLSSPAPPLSTTSTPTNTNPTGSPPSGSGNPTTPPRFIIIPSGRNSTEPNVYVELSAFRIELLTALTHRIVGYRYYFVAQDIDCVNGATNLIFTVGHKRHTTGCPRTPIRISSAIKPNRRYRVRVEAVRIRHRRIVKRGASYSGRLYMPGNRGHWTLVSGIPPAA